MSDIEHAIRVIIWGFTLGGCVCGISMIIIEWLVDRWKDRNEGS